MCKKCNEQLRKIVLNELLGNVKQKHGLFDAISSVLKIFFGIVTENDLEYLSSEFDKLYQDHKLLAASI